MYARIATTAACLLLTVVLAAEEPATPPAAPQPPEGGAIAAPELLVLKAIAIFARTTEPFLVIERPEDIGPASHIKSGAGQMRPLVRGADINKGDTILIGGENQFYGRFGDGSVLSLAPLTVVNMNERNQTGDNEISTILHLIQGSARVRISPIAAEGPFIIRLPNVKEGPVDVNPNGGHVFLFPSEMKPNKSLTFDVAVFAGEALLTLPVTIEKTEKGEVIKVERTTEVTIPTGMFVRLTFRYEKIDDPTMGGPVYMLYLVDADLKPKPHNLATPTEPVAPPRIVGGGDIIIPTPVSP